MNKKSAETRVSYYKRPNDLTPAEYQIKLREQFVENHPFEIQNVGLHPYLSDYLVKNPLSGNSYKVAIRDFKNQWNFCSCLDFKTNQLGICKHTAAVLYSLKDKKSDEVFQTPYSSIYVDYKNGRTVKLKIGTENKEVFSAFAKRYFDAQMTLLGTSFPVFEQVLKEAKRISEDFVCYEDALAFVLETRDNIKRRVKILEAFSKKNKEKVLDKVFRIPLFDFQAQGVQFASLAGRSLIADEMGLGKTVQALATAEVYKHVFKISKVLIVCPTSLKYQWKSEIERFTFSSAEVIEGNKEQRIEVLKNSESFYLITSYQSISNDVQDAKIDFGLDMIILDEAQRIKNWNTKVASNIKKLQSPYAVVLTGTPLENKLEELYSIMQFVDVWKLGPLYKYLEKYRIVDEQTQKVIGYQNLNEISEVLSDTLLRRTKKEVLTQLPERVDKTLLVSMTPEQRLEHDKYSEQVSRLVSRWQKTSFLSEKDRQMLILNLSKMRMVCDSTFILDQSSRYDTKIQELMTLLDEFLENEDNKVVVFSQWEKMTRLVSEELEKRNIEFVNLNGSVSALKRKKMVDSFQEEKKIRVFVSTDAGGVGLNLQAANMVVNLDVPWNPAVLEQRIGRVFRLGQKQNVTVVNFVSAHTIEERMLNVLGFKSSLAAGILDDAEDTIFLQDDKFATFMGAVSDLTQKSENRFDEVEENEEKPDLYSFLENPGIISDFIRTYSEVDKDGKTYIKIPIEQKEVIEKCFDFVKAFMEMVKVK